MEIIENIKEAADELKDQNDRTEVEYGELLAYADHHQRCLYGV